MYEAAYVIRQARPEDAPLLAQAQRVIARNPGQLASLPEEIKDQVIQEKIVTLTDGKAGLCVVIENGGRIVGHAFLERHKLAVVSHVVFLTIVIHEGSQGRGFGKTLMQYLIGWARANPEIEKFELQVRSSNTRAINLYQKLGFVEEGRKTRRIKYGPSDYQDDVYMALWVG